MAPCELRSRERTLRARASRNASPFLPDSQESLGSSSLWLTLTLENMHPFPWAWVRRRYAPVWPEIKAGVCVVQFTRAAVFQIPWKAACRTCSMSAPCAEPPPAQGCCWLKVALLLELGIGHGCRQTSWRIRLVKLSSQFDLIYVIYPTVFFKISK